MTQRKAEGGLDFEALRLGIERCDPELVLGFYSEDVELRVVNVGTPRASPFELRGRAEIAKYLRASFGPETSHRVEREVIGEGRVTFREACEYPDGDRVVVETTLELRDGKIVRQVDVVARDSRADGEGETGPRLPALYPRPATHPGVDAFPADRLPRSEQEKATEKEDFG